MKKIRRSLIALTGLASIACLASCGTSDASSNTLNANALSNLSSENQTLVKESIEAINTINFMESEGEFTANGQMPMNGEMSLYNEASEETEALTNNSRKSHSNKSKHSKKTKTTYTTPEVVDIDQITSLVSRANVLLENSISVETVESDLEEYIEKQILTYNDTTYVLYISESTTITEEKEERDGTEIETETKYSGILVDGENEYPFVAKTEDEIEISEDGEEGTEKELKLTVTLDENTTVTIKQEIEVEGENIEEEFSCKYKVDGETTEAFKVSSDYEDGVLKIKVKENDSTFKLKYYTEDDVNYLNIKYDTYEVLLTVTSTTDEEGNTVITYAPVTEEATEETTEETAEETTEEATEEATEEITEETIEETTEETTTTE